MADQADQHAEYVAAVTDLRRYAKELLDVFIEGGYAEDDDDVRIIDGLHTALGRVAHLGTHSDGGGHASE